MKAGELLHIVDEIKKNEETDLTKIAAKLPANRAYLSKRINGAPEIDITPTLLRKFQKAFPTYFPIKRKNNSQTTVNGSNLEAGQPLLYFGNHTVDDLINEKEARRKEALDRAEIAEKEKDRLLAIIETNLSKAVVGIETIQLGVYSVRQVSLKSLSRIENPKGPEDALLKEADNIVKKMRGTAGKKDTRD